MRLKRARAGVRSAYLQALQLVDGYRVRQVEGKLGAAANELLGVRMEHLEGHHAQLLRHKLAGPRAHVHPHPPRVRRLLAGNDALGTVVEAPLPADVLTQHDLGARLELQKAWDGTELLEVLGGAPVHQFVDGLPAGDGAGQSGQNDAVVQVTLTIGPVGPSGHAPRAVHPVVCGTHDMADEPAVHVAATNARETIAEVLLPVALTEHNGEVAEDKGGGAQAPLSNASGTRLPQ